MHGHGTKPYPCTYKGCDRAAPGNGFPRKWNLHDHMQRVHNAAPPPEDDARKESLKSRKRKTEPSGKSTSGRKSSKSRRSSPKVEVPVKVDMSAKLKEEWKAVQAGMANVLPGFDQIDDPMVMMHIDSLKESLNHLGRIHVDYMAIKNGGLHQQQNNFLARQSG